MVINGWLSESHSGGSAVEDSILRTESRRKLTRAHKNPLSKWQRCQDTWREKGGRHRRENRLGREIGKESGGSLMLLINAFYIIDI